MSLRQELRKNGDYILLGIVALILIICLIMWAFIHQDRATPSTRIQRFDVVNPHQDKIIPPDRKYPPPAKEQLAFNTYQNTGNLYIELFWTNRNVNRVAEVGPHGFEQTIYNPLNETVKLTPEQLKAVSIGCIARVNPYRPETISPMTELTLQPYEKRHITIGMAIDCLYLGTADTRYFWRIY